MHRTLVRSQSMAALLLGVLVMSVPNVAASVRQASAATCRTGSSGCPIRISFASGAYSAQGRGTLSGPSTDTWFSVRARAGQSMIVIVKGAGPTRGIVYFPNGRHTGQPGGRVFDQVLPASGTYRIRVSESQMGEPWRGAVVVLVVAY